MATSEAEIKVTTEAAEQFITLYYQALSNLSPLASFYTSSSPRYAAVAPDISINGLANLSPAQYEAMLVEQSNPPIPSTSTSTTASSSTTTTVKPTATAINGGSRPTPRVTYSYESFDAHVANPHFSLGDPPPPTGPGSSSSSSSSSSAPVGQRASVLVQVTGRMRFGKARETPDQSFSEVFVLVPNWDALGRNAPRNAKRWLIMSQNFRAL